MPPSKQSTKTQIQSPKKDGPVIYLVTFRGQYLNGNTEGGRSGFVNYETTVRMSEAMVDFNSQSIFAGVLAPTIMPQRYPDYRSLSTFEVVKTVREDGAPITNIKQLNRAELESLVVREKLPINLAIFKDSEDLRQAILNCAKDKTKFLQQQKAQAPKLIERDKFVNEALALNPAPTLDGKEDTAAQVNSEPTLDEILKTKDALDKKAKAAKAIDPNLDPYDTPDTDKTLGSYKGGRELMTDVLSKDEFPDGRHSIDGAPVDVGF